MKKDFLSILDFNQDQIMGFLLKAKELKKFVNQNIQHKILDGKTLAMIFQKPSNRTRVSFEIGMFQLGGLALNIQPQEIEMGVRESISAVAKTLSRYVSAIMLRLYKHEDLLEFAKFATVPVINGLTDLEHPCQALADLLTIMEKKPNLEQIKIAYLGDGNNVCTSLMQITNLFKIKMQVACPQKYQPISHFPNVEIINSAEDAVSNADVVYTDVWISMGQENEKEQRIKDFQGFQVNQELFQLAKKDAIFMHCLPAHPGQEVSSEILESPNSVIYDQAENRLHVQKAILSILLK